MNPNTLRELCEQYLNGNRSAEDRIYQKCRGTVAKMVRDRGVPGMDVDDVVSDVIVSILAQAQKVVQYGWRHVTFIVRTEVRAYRRKRDKDALGHRQMEISHADENEGPHTLPDKDRRRAPPLTVSKAAELSELERLLQSALTNLTENQRQAIRLKLDEGLTYNEIAATLGHPLGTVKQWLHDGRAALAEFLRRHNGDDFP